MRFLSTQKVIMIFLFIFSLMPYKYDSKLHIVKAKKKYVMMSIIISSFLQIFYLFVAIITIKSFSGFVEEDSKVTEMVYMVEIWSLEIGVLIIFCNGLIKKNKQVRFLNYVSAIECKINRLKYLFNQKEVYQKFMRTSLQTQIATIAFYGIVGL